MSNRAKVLFMSNGQFERFMRGEFAGVRNWPQDAKLAGIAHGVKDATGTVGVGIRIESRSFDPVAHGDQLPVAQATFFTRGG